MSQPFQMCPVCGGPIHPIAGRCKHCKADLNKMRADAERAARAARMNAPAVMPADAQYAAPPPQAAAPATRAAQNGSQPMAAAAPPAAAIPPDPSAPVAFPPGYYVQPQSVWSRRWPLAVGALAILAIGVSVGVMAGRSADSDDDTGLRKSGPSKRPHMVPDRMPQVPSPGPNQGGGSGSDPHGSIPPGWGPSNPAPGPGFPTRPGTAPNVGQFAVALTSTVCAKLNDCGVIDDFSQVLCKELAQSAEDPFAEERVRRGECNYDRTAAAACLDTIRDLSCTAQPADVMDWLTHAGSLMECTSAYVCN